MRGNKLRIAMLISGGGTTMQRIIQACKSGQLPYVEVACVIASKPDAGGIAKALAEGVSESDVLVRRPKYYGTSEEFGAVLLRDFQTRGVNFVGQYGWLPLTPAVVVREYDRMMTNQHPGPLRPGFPDFGGKGMYGRRVHAARINFVHSTCRSYWTEATCQYVSVIFDQGLVIRKERVPLFEDDDVETLQKRVLPVEHQVQIEALRDFSNNRVVIQPPIRDLVFSGEEPVLELAKELAIKDWPKG